MYLWTKQVDHFRFNLTGQHYDVIYTRGGKGYLIGIIEEGVFWRRNPADYISAEGDSLRISQDRACTIALCDLGLIDIDRSLDRNGRAEAFTMGRKERKYKLTV